MHLVIPDPTPDEPTVPEPSVCEACDGSRLEAISVIVPGRYGREIREELTGRPCPDCCCEVCGQPTETPPICRDCEERS